jgi:hypothetical protein
LAAYFTRETASIHIYNDQGNSLITVGNWNQQQRCHALL